MASLFNQFSAVLLFIILGLGGLALLLYLVPATKRRMALLAGIGIVVLAGLFIFRPAPGATSSSEVETMLSSGNGRPVLLELYSDY